jgi:toxin ParE1/3/4
VKLDITRAALEDLRSIRAYTLETWGPAQEEVYLEGLWRKFGALQAHPEIHRFRNDLFPGCQLAAEGKHVILFKVDGEVLQIVRVLHSAMDFRRRVEGGE